MLQSFLALLLSFSTGTAAGPSVDRHRIGPLGIGPVQVGQTLDEARRALPSASFQSESDGDGAAFVSVLVDSERLMTLWTQEEEDEPDAPIDWTQRIWSIQTFDTACRTAEGVHPGSLVSGVETIYGPVTGISRSEIESRQIVTFAHQPPKYAFRMDNAGIFPPGSRTTRRFDPKARILAIDVLSR